jgi:hypothetical protein
VESGLALLTSGLFSVSVAVVSGFIAYYTARANSRVNLEGELKKIKEQIAAQQAVEERGAIANLRQRYLTPLGYYAQVLSGRFAELEAKLASDENLRVRKWFEEAKDHATRDRPKVGFVAWCYYEGLFSMTTLYYTCSYFHFAREVRFRRPLGERRPLYSERLAGLLGRVTAAFAWDAERGLWDASQEMIGERFAVDGTKMTYAAMCDELDAEATFRRAAFFRPLDFYGRSLDIERAGYIKAALDALVSFLNAHDPQTYEALVQERVTGPPAGDVED